MAARRAVPRGPILTLQHVGVQRSHRSDGLGRVGKERWQWRQLTEFRPGLADGLQFVLQSSFVSAYRLAIRTTRRTCHSSAWLSCLVYSGETSS